MEPFNVEPNQASPGSITLAAVSSRQTKAYAQCEARKEEHLRSASRNACAMRVHLWFGDLRSSAATFRSE
eukprot:6460041-Amphidinium_carterae.1